MKMGKMPLEDIACLIDYISAPNYPIISAYEKETSQKIADG